MGIQAEFNPDLALREYAEYEKGNRSLEECIPKDLEEGQTYDFLKKGQRLYWFSNDPFWHNGEMPLMITQGNQKLSRPIASIKLLEATHFLKDDEVYTKGKYKVLKVFKDEKIYFEAYKRVKIDGDKISDIPDEGQD